MMIGHAASSPRLTENNAMQRKILWLIVFIFCAISPVLQGAEIPEPTLKDVAYGKHPKQLMHVWLAKSDKPTPLLFFVHGGGWQGGNRMNRHLTGMLEKLLENKISAVSVEYRFIKEAVAEGVEPPVKAPLHDAARALQFVRSQAKEWNIDPANVIACGGSAGACTSLWLAFHDDMAQPQSKDPVARQSTRLAGAAVIGAQTTLDPAQMVEWTPNSKYGSHAFGIFKEGDKKWQQDFAAFLEKRDSISEWIQEYSPFALVTSDDPPVYLYYGAKPGLGKPQKDPTHTSNFGVKLQEHCKNNGVACELQYPGAPGKPKQNAEAYLLAAFKAKPKTQKSKQPKPNSPMAKIVDDPALPRVLLIGDSISIGYTVPVRKLLAGKANVHRPLTNCGPTTKGVAAIDEWLGDGKWDVIHFNFGLHDLKYMGPDGQNLADPNSSTSHQQVPPEEYAANVEKIVKRLQATGAKLIWRNTTPVPPGAKGRVVGDSEKYNQIAAEIMSKNGIPTNDLYSVSKERMAKIMRPANVHFTAEGSQALAEKVVESIEAALK